jgi:Flp pilus assembly pilin Flp
MRAEIRAEPWQEWGQTMAEYAVVLGVITLATVTAFTALSSGIRGLLQQVAALL